MNSSEALAPPVITSLMTRWAIPALLAAGTSSSGPAAVASWNARAVGSAARRMRALAASAIKVRPLAARRRGRGRCEITEHLRFGGDRRTSSEAPILAGGRLRHGYRAVIVQGPPS